MASLFELSAGGSDGDASGGSKSFQNQIIILCLSEGGIAMSLEGKVLLNTANPQGVEGMIRNNHGPTPTTHLEWMVQKKEEYERLVFFVHYYIATGRWRGMNYHFPNLLLDGNMAPILLQSKHAGLILGWNDEKEDFLPKKDSTAKMKEKSSPTVTEELSPEESATTLYTCAVSSPTPMGGQNSWSSTTSLDTDGVSSPTSKWQPSSPALSTISCTDLAPVPRFKKSRVLAGEAAHISLEMRLQALKVGYNVNSNYRGEINQFTLDNARCPPEQNCALHITGIDPEATLQEIFGVILEGNVFSFHKKNTIPGKFDTCAATLVFMERQPAELFLARSCEYPGINIRGSQIRAIWNREPVRPRPGSEQRQSRVLLITGPQHEFTAEGLERFFHSRLDFNLVDRREWLEAGGQRTVEFHFSRIQGQSRLAFKCFCVELDEQGAKDKFSIRYGIDPCNQLNRIRFSKLYRH